MAANPKTRDGITVRSLLAGAVAACTIGGGAAFETLMVSGSTMNFDYSMGAALFVFSLFVLVANPVMGLVHRPWAFSRSELAVVYIMGAVACVLPTNGLLGLLIPAISGGIYYATPENNWIETILPHLRPWLMITDQAGVKAFYEGLSHGERIPWGIWVGPLAVWSLLLTGVFGSVIALMSLMRRQWVVNERLLYPLVQVPMAMIGEEGDTRRGGFAEVFRRRAFWFGVAVPFLLYSTKAMHHYIPTFPQGFPTFIRVAISNAVGVSVGINWAGIGFGYLLTTKLSFSIWFMAVLTLFEEALFMRLGIFSSERLAYNTSASVYPAYQGVGALLTFTLLMLWTSRRYLAQAARQAWRGEPRAEEEILSYRNTFILLVVSLGLVAGWLVAAGLQLWVTVLFLTLFYLMFLGITRVVVEGGLAVSRIPILPNDLVLATVGGSTLGATNIGALGMTFPFAGELRTSLMSAIAHGLKLAHSTIGTQGHGLLVAIVLAIVGSLARAGATMLYLGHHHGAINLSASWFFGSGAGGSVFRYIEYHVTHATATRWSSMGFIGFGAVAQAALTLAYQRLAWWPIHPLAFPIGAIWCTHQVIASMFLAWIAKLATLHYGGVRLYRSARPLFLGFILGQYLTGGLWLVIDALKGMQGNYLFYW